MKGKPVKPGKAGKTAKVKEEPPAELTPKQLKEKRREEARARAAETRKIVTSGVGQWTGKLPAQLLNEHAQKNKWERVEYLCRNKGTEEDGKYSCTVVLGRRNAKTKEVEKVRFDMPDSLNPVQPTALEARHLAATYAMHRIMPKQNMKMMLPPFHRDLWIAMDALKLEAKKHEQHQWNEDPWQAQAERKAARTRAAEEGEARAKERERATIARELRAEQDKEKEASSERADNPVVDAARPRRIKFNHSLSLSRKTRAVLESVVREHNGFRFSRNEHLNRESPEYQKILGMLQKLGFKKPFAEEALEHTDSLRDALAWLLVHVPEDDVPKEFMPTDLNITARLSTGIESERAISQLRSYGYSEDVALSAIASADLRSAVVQLTQTFVGVESTASLTDDTTMWTEDVESLEALIEEKVVCSEHSVSVHFPKFKFTVYMPRGYPDAVPGIAFESAKPGLVSKFALLAATKNAAEFVQAQLLGDYMLISLHDHVKSVFDSICAKPGKLSNISNAVFGAREDIHPKKVHKRKMPLVVVDKKIAVAEREQRMATESGRRMLQQRAQLPAWKKRQAIVDLVRNNQLVLLTGETGSGKSTQTVQFILDDVPDAVILCTQPRRISAIGVAQRVAEERCVELGGEVGFVIKGESKSSARTQIKFVTSGVLLRMLQDTDAGLGNTTHIFVDEVHERSLDSDFLLILLKRLLLKSPKLKVVLMSATVNATQFLQYFGSFKSATVHVEGRTFPVEQHYLDDILRFTNYRPKAASQEEDIGKLIAAVRENSKTRVDYNLVAALVHRIDQHLGDSDGSILVFMSGTAEIEQTIQAINNAGKRLFVLPLHASLSSNEQRKVFKSPPKGLRKVVVSTNVAETSITIPDVVAVVDSGRVKETQYDSTQNASRLVDVMESRASAAQRMGRAGRVRAGDGYKLFTKNTEETRMAPRPLPEIQRAPLEVLYLRVKAMGVQDVAKFLASALDPPPTASVDVARSSLIARGMLDAKHNELTSLGRLVSTIPADPQTAKLLVLGTLLGCLPTALTIAAILSHGRMPPLEPHASGDLLAAAAVFDCWRAGEAVPGSAITCRAINAARAQLVSALIQTGLLPSGRQEKDWPEEATIYSREEAVVRAVVGAALQPSIAEVVAPTDAFVATAGGALRKEDEDLRTAKLFLPNGTRVFAHPRSVVWQGGALASAPYVSFAQTVLTSKHFITDLTPFSVCALVLFSTSIDVDPFGNGIVIDGWTGLRCWPRIGLALRCLQTLLAELCDAKFRNPESSLKNNKVLQIVHDLLASEGRAAGIGLLA